MQTVVSSHLGSVGVGPEQTVWGAFNLEAKLALNAFAVGPPVTTASLTQGGSR
jgi:hypothetical protein